MAFLGRSKKEPDHAPSDPGTADCSAAADKTGPGTADAELLANLIDRLSRRLGQAAEEQLAGHLETLLDKVDGLEKGLDTLADAGRLTPAAGAAPGAGSDMTEAAVSRVVDALRGLEDRLDRLEKLLERQTQQAGPQQQSDAGAEQQIRDALAQLRAAVDGQKEDSAAALRRLRQEMDERLQELVEYVRPDTPDTEAAAPAGAREWQRAILGPTLAEDSALDFQRQQLLDGVLSGHPGACALAGQLLTFQSSPAEKMAPLLKEIGEAFYRWQPKEKPGSSKLEEALVRWLKRACEDAGIGNSIELVHPGERFDAGRHTAAGRGVEITRVLGWVVLRDNGRVYTKAAVEVR